jgi:hypothetical protein
VAPKNSRTTHPATSQQVEQKLDARHIDYEFEPNLKTDDIREVEGIQVRQISHRAPKDMTQRYATAMRHGAPFPAIVVNDANELVDGNTRLAAKRRNGEDTIAAYRCHNLSALDARSLSVELNQSNGLAMTEKEIRGFIVGILESGSQPEVKTLARMTGVRDTKIQRWINEARFSSRAAGTGIPETLTQALPDSSRAALHGVKLEPVFKDLTELAAEARVPAQEVKRLVSSVNAASSEADAAEIVAAERRERVEAIKAFAAGVKPRARASKGSAQHVGGLIRFTAEDLLDVDEDKQYESYLRLKELRDRLQQVVQRAEHEWNLTPPAPSTEPELAGVA